MIDMRSQIPGSRRAVVSCRRDRENLQHPPGPPFDCMRGKADTAVQLDSREPKQKTLLHLSLDVGIVGHCGVEALDLGAEFLPPAKTLRHATQLICFQPREEKMLGWTFRFENKIDSQTRVLGICVKKVSMTKTPTETRNLTMILGGEQGTLRR